MNVCFVRVSALIAASCLSHAHAAPQAMTYEQAVDKATSLKGCAKRDIGVIESVYASDSNGNPVSPGSGKQVHLVVQAKGAVNSMVLGPIATPPTDDKLQALRGRRTCVISD